jgi:tRNA threonylcarbamoyladenosine biosynthesis protein TsaE
MIKTDITITNSSEETFSLGVKLGQNAIPGAVYALDGELGSGKTVLAQGIANGLGIKDVICSPTFTIMQLYDTGRMPLYHFDVYRIGHPDEMYEIGYDDYIYGQGLTIIEWSNLIADLLPQNRTEIQIEKDLEKGFQCRKITIRDVQEVLL